MVIFIAKLQTEAELEKIIHRYRKRIGIDTVCSINLRIEPIPTKKSRLSNPTHKILTDAWIKRESSHPIYTLCISRRYLVDNKNYPKHIIRTIVHELFHILIEDTFKRLKPSYTYNNTKDALVEETLVIRLARALIPVASEELYEQT